MANLVDIYRSDKDTVIKRRQLPLVINEKLSMVMDLNSMGLVCDNPDVKGRELEDFIRKYNILSPEEIRQSFQVTCDDLVFILGQILPCVGCRRSVERLFCQLSESGHNTLDPLVITPGGILTLRPDKLSKPQALCTLLHGHSSQLQCLVENQPRSKKSRRCALHSLESNRARIMAGSWREVWECMQSQCREEVTFINFQTLQDTLDSYLRKHRFCGECRTKVIKAYQLLVEDKDPQKEKGYVGVLYAGIRRCLADKHLHLPADSDYIKNLIVKAEPELLGSHRERHAKTLEIAQEEVLICLGICLYERLHRISLRLREEEVTCQVLAAVAVEALHRKFETAVERKCGVTKLELLCEEITKEEAAKQQRKEQKKLRKRKKKGRRTETDKCEEDIEEEEQGDGDETSPCMCEECEAQKVELSLEIENNNKNCFEYSQEINVNSCHSCNSEQSLTQNGPTNITRRFMQASWSSCEHSQDYGYSSGNNNGCCESVSGSSTLPSSPEGSEVACSDSCCNHEGAECTNTLTTTSTSHCTKGSRDTGTGFTLSLQDMLMESDDDNECIPLEDIMEFKSRHNITERRQELRKNLRMKFAQLCCNPKQTQNNSTAEN